MELLLILANQNSETTTEIEQYYKKETVTKVKRIDAAVSEAEAYTHGDDGAGSMCIY